MPEVRVWAPNAVRVRVTIAEPGGSIDHPVVITDLEPDRGPDLDSNHEVERGSVASGWWRADVADALPGRDYGFLLDDDEQVLPDPRSRWQPHGVHQPSRFYSDDFAWTDAGWPGHGLPDSVIYELHIGTFTPATTRTPGCSARRRAMLQGVAPKTSVKTSVSAVPSAQRQACASAS